eukprot:12837984-Ditylum_brightwellii.AAC.1
MVRNQGDRNGVKVTMRSSNGGIGREEKEGGWKTAGQEKNGQEKTKGKEQEQTKKSGEKQKRVTIDAMDKDE